MKKAMVASSELGLQTIMDTLIRVAKQYDMKINVKKTKVMRISKTGVGGVALLVEGQLVEQVAKFKYLDSLIAADGRYEREIRASIGMTKDTFGKRKELLTRKKKIIKAIVWSVALYGAETWTLRQEDRRHLDALET